MDKKTGGPAFPPSNPGYAHGMTMRDYFAAQTQPEGELGIAAAEAITGLKAPDYDKYKDKADFWVESIGFWAIAHAKYRYMQADAMLEARET